jgi:hypothetical protein
LRPLHQRCVGFGQDDGHLGQAAPVEFGQRSAKVHALSEASDREHVFRNGPRLGHPGICGDRRAGIFERMPGLQAIVITIIVTRAAAISAHHLSPLAGLRPRAVIARIGFAPAPAPPLARLCAQRWRASAPNALPGGSFVILSPVISGAGCFM